MKGRMQQTFSRVNDYLQRNRTDSEWYEGVQPFMWMTEDNIVEVPYISNGIENRNRRMPNGTYGGVRGRKMK